MSKNGQVLLQEAKDQISENCGSNEPRNHYQRGEDVSERAPEGARHVHEEIHHDHQEAFYQQADPEVVHDKSSHTVVEPFSTKAVVKGGGRLPIKDICDLFKNEED